VSHLIAIVSDLHELARAEADGFTLELAPIAPVEVLTKVVELFEHRLGEMDIALQSNLDAVAGCRVMGDAERLHQLFTNLLHNVLRHAEGADRLTLAGRCADRHLELVFSDNGPGVPEEAMAHLFDRLFRVDPSRSRTTGGSGIGLSVCQTIVEGHGGTISAANATAPEQGLRITVRIPLLPAVVAATTPFPLPGSRRE
jgi:two-component system sensor histidine kinase BaeS